MTPIRKHPVVPEGSVLLSVLDQLLEAEQEIAALERNAVAAAHEILGRARSEIEVLERQGAEALASELEELDATARHEQQARIAEIEAEAACHAARYRALSPSEIAGLATFVADRLTGRLAETAP
jgi:hypothetical protein